MNLNEDKQVYMYNKHKAITKQLQPSFACQNCNFFYQLVHQPKA